MADSNDFDPIKNYNERKTDNIEVDLERESVYKSIKNEPYEVWKEKVDDYNKNFDEKEMAFTKKFAFYFLMYFAFLFVMAIISVICIFYEFNKMNKSLENAENEIQINVDDEQSTIVDISEYYK